MGIFSINSPLMRFLNTVANILALHLLWILYSLPIFTIGASTTALYYTCMKMIRVDEGYILRNFHKSFKENFRQSTIIWIGMVMCVAFLITDIRYGMFLNNAFGKGIIISCSFCLIPFLLTALYIFPVQAKFENRIIDNIKNALILSMRHFGMSLILILIIGSIVFLALFFMPFMGLMLACGMGIIGYLTSNVYVYIFRKYVPGELEDDLERTGETFETN